MPPGDTRSNLGFRDKASRLQPSVAFIVMIFGALVAFEIFNYTTTDHALADLLGDLTFASIPWSTILAIAFCGIDFAGIARLFTPEQGLDEPKEVWYLFGAWLLAATMNAILTWWGVSLAVAGHSEQSSTVVAPQTITNVVPVFVAVMVWVIRILIIGTLANAMDRMLHPGMERRSAVQNAVSGRQASRSIPTGLSSSPVSSRPAVTRGVTASASSNSRMSRSSAPADDEGLLVETVSRAQGEPTYHSLGRSAKPPANAGSQPVEGGASNRFRRS